MRISDWSSDVCSSDLIGVARAQCGGAKTAVQLGVAFITYANPAGVKQANNRRDSLLPTDTRLLQVPLHARPQLGQRAAEPSAPVELVRFLPGAEIRSEEHTSELQSLMRISYAVFCLKQ